MIPYGRQDISEDDIQAVVDVLRSDFLTQGPAVPAFEAAVADYCGAGHAIAVNSATSALHIACLALGVGPGDWVWTSPITFVASSNCALYCGAQVDFVDIDPRTYNLSVDALADKLVLAEQQGRLPKVVIPVHLAGQPCDMAGIRRLANRYGFRVIEDASHAIGGRYQGMPIGRGQFSDLVVFSFHPVKVITTAEGGMVLTNDPELARRVQLLRSHGITREAEEMDQAPDGPWYYQQVTLGFNYRMTDLQAALGLSQMKRVDSFVEARHAIARRYNESLRAWPLRTPYQHPEGYSGLHLYIVRLDLAPGRPSHRKFFDALRSEGIGVNLHYIPVYLQPHYRSMGFRPGHCPNAEAYYADALSLPMYPGLTEGLQGEVVTAIRKALS